MNATCDPPVVIVLASGRGERFVAAGGAGSKLRALLAGKPVLDHTLDAVRASGLPYHVEDQGHPGMGDSIAAAVRATSTAPGWLILPGDLPLISPESLRAVASALQTHTVVLPIYHGQRGHPVGFSSSCREALLQLHGAEGAAAVVKANPGAMRLELDDPGIVVDVDTPDDLSRAEQLLAGR
jgi:molybdenum cofactor cytidylyltransferase